MLGNKAKREKQSCDRGEALTKLLDPAVSEALKILLRLPNDISVCILLLFKLIMLLPFITPALGSLTGFIRSKFELIFVILPPPPAPASIFPISVNGNPIHVVAYTGQSSVVYWVIVLNLLWNYSHPFCHVTLQYLSLEKVACTSLYP